MVCAHPTLLPSNVAFEYALVSCLCSGIETIDKQDVVDRARVYGEQSAESEYDPAKAVGRSPPN